MWRSKSKDFPSVLIQFMHYLSNVLISHGCERLRLWEVLADQTIGILVRAPFPCDRGMEKLEVSLQLGGDMLKLVKFFGVVTLWNR